MKTATSNILKKLFLLIMLINSTICQNKPLSTEQIPDLESGVCQHEYCIQERLEENIQTMTTYELKTKNFNTVLSKFNKNQLKSYILSALFSLAPGALIGYLLSKNSVNRGLCFGIPTSLASFAFLSLIINLSHKKPSKPTLCITRQCFISKFIQVIEEYRAQTKLDASWWLSLNNSKDISNEIIIKFPGKRYPFMAALDVCVDLLEELKQAESAAIKLQEASKSETIKPEMLLDQSELYDLREAQKKVFTIKSTIETCYPLSIERNLKELKNQALKNDKNFDSTDCFLKIFTSSMKTLNSLLHLFVHWNGGNCCHHCNDYC